MGVEPRTSDFDYLVIGGGTAGCVVASRLSEDPDVTVGLLEWGPSDDGDERVSSIRRWPELDDDERVLSYTSVPQERGNSSIAQPRARMLGGCSTINTMIAWQPLASDLREWVELGATGWTPEALRPYVSRLRIPINVIPPADQNELVADMISSAAAGLDVPVQERWNDGRLDAETRGTGFFEIGYDPDTNRRSSSSAYYIRGLEESRGNLSVLTETRARRVLTQQDDDGLRRATGVELKDGSVLRATREVIVCAGAIESVKLLQLSGIGPRRVLEEAGVDVVVELPGVGENLQDHAEARVYWETTRAPSEVSATGWDAGVLLASDDAPDRPEIEMHFPTLFRTTPPASADVADPGRIVVIAPNVAKPASRGRIWIVSDDVDAAPAIDYRYFTDPEGHDERVLVAGVRAARKIAGAAPMRDWIVRELFPGPEAQTDEEISAAARAAHYTVCHVSGTCKIGAREDAMAVVDPELRVYGIPNLRIADASVFPTVTAVNPVVTVVVLAERAADLVKVSA